MGTWPFIVCYGGFRRNDTPRLNPPHRWTNRLALTFAAKYCSSKWRRISPVLPGLWPLVEPRSALLTSHHRRNDEHCHRVRSDLRDPGTPAQAWLKAWCCLRTPLHQLRLQPRITTGFWCHRNRGTPAHRIRAITSDKGLYQASGVNAMNPTRIICVVVLFQVVLIFCMWVSFSPRVISPGEIVARAGIVAAVAAAIFTAIASSHHRRLR